MLTMPNGEKRWPLLSSSDIRSLLEITSIRRYQLVQRSMTRIELRLETERDVPAAKKERLCEWVRQKFGAAFEVGITVLDEIPRPASGKFQDFISEVAD